MTYFNFKNLWTTSLACIFLCGNMLSQTNDLLTKGDLVPNFAEVDEQGNEIVLENYKGKIVLLNFTATWCGPCWEMYTPMHELQEQYGEDLVIISFHLDEMKEKWGRKAKSKGIVFDVISIWDSDHKKAIMNSFAPDLFPNFVLIDKKGYVKKKWDGNSTKLLKRYVHQAMRKF